ncbi:MAG: histidinol phosphate phosphatase [Planctomycetales bacterium 4484_123]|nr:MAG: histidinol phosphate phosphatase [Planctomycetales bacterium 4484_123]
MNDLSGPVAPRRRPFKTTLLIPVLNEIEGMRAIMPRIRREWVDQVVVLDGGSTDGSAEYARELGHVVHVQRRPGIRTGYLEALPLVLGEVIVTFSPEGNSIPELIPRLLDKMEEGYDMVIASRYLDGAVSLDDDVVTAFGNWLFTRTVNVLYGGRYTDIMVIFRAYRKELIRLLGLDGERAFRLPERLFRTHISWEPLLSVRCARRKLKVAEIPGDEPPRIGGRRKLQILRWGAAYYLQLLRDRFIWP